MKEGNDKTGDRSTFLSAKMLVELSFSPANVHQVELLLEDRLFDPMEDPMETTAMNKQSSGHAKQTKIRYLKDNRI